ncbi:MAG: glycerate kinase, partial [Chloroflexi bacterium]|nr:glycerate kinase [Chloroflexota bacterium]
VGLAQALGGRFLDDDGRELSWGGAALLKLATTDTTGLDPRISQGELLAAVDVSNPLCGPQGAALTYASQKGASSAMVELLDQALAHLAEVVHRQLHREVEDLPGAGAGGGLGAGLAAFLGARLVPGADLVCDLLGLDKLLEGVDLVVVGEGRLDLQTAFNKAPVAVARRAEAKGIPAVAIGGSLGRGYQELYAYGIEVIVAAAPESVPLEEAMRAARHLVAEAAERAVRLFLSRRG